MGVDDRVLRRPARHHNICTCLDCQPRKLVRQRADDTRGTARDIHDQLAVIACPACGWTDMHPHEALGYRCVWCRHLFTEEA